MESLVWSRRRDARRIPTWKLWLSRGLGTALATQAFYREDDSWLTAWYSYGWSVWTGIGTGVGAKNQASGRNITSDKTPRVSTASIPAETYWSVVQQSPLSGPDSTQEDPRGSGGPDEGRWRHSSVPGAIGLRSSMASVTYDADSSEILLCSCRPQLGSSCGSGTALKKLLETFLQKRGFAG